MSIGKQIRMSRLIEPDTGMSIICALDHGMTAPEVPSGLVETRTRAREAISGGANVLMLSRGFAGRVYQEFKPTTSLALMLTASAAGRPSGSQITPIGSVEEALTIGADAVVVYVALAGEDEPAMIQYASRVGASCARLGMPFIAEAEFPDAYSSLETISGGYGATYLKRNARLCVELGADIVKVNWSGDEDSFADIVKACNAPVVVAGGTVVSDEVLLERLASARRAGAIGCSVGRNIFQHERPEALTRAISRIFREGAQCVGGDGELREGGHESVVGVSRSRCGCRSRHRGRRCPQELRGRAGAARRDADRQRR